MSSCKFAENQTNFSEENTFAKLRNKVPLPDLFVGDSSIVIIPLYVSLVMLLSEHIWTSLLQDGLLTRRHLVGVLDLPEVHGGHHGSGQDGPHGEAARGGGQHQLGIVDVVEYLVVSGEKDNAGDDEHCGQCSPHSSLDRADHLDTIRYRARSIFASTLETEHNSI